MTAPDSPEVQSLLEGFGGSARVEHAELVAWLLGQGAAADQIRNSPMQVLLASRRILGDDDIYVSPREISENHGVDVELVQRMLGALGLARSNDPEAAVYLRADGQTAAHFQKFLEAGLDPEHVIQVVHVVSEGLSRAAEVMRYIGLAAALRPGATELEIAQRSQALVNRVAPLLESWIPDVLFLHLRGRTDTEAVTFGERAAGGALPGARDITVAFVDLVDFTQAGEEGPAERLEELAHRLTDRARVVAVPPVRFIKTIGDAVMFICTDPKPLLDAVLQLVYTSETGTDVHSLRVGVASGPAISRAGDWFGSPVNIASRVTATASSGTVVTTESVRQAVGEASGLSWSFSGEHALKGIRDKVKLFRTWRDDNAR